MTNYKRWCPPQRIFHSFASICIAHARRNPLAKLCYVAKGPRGIVNPIFHVATPFPLTRWFSIHRSRSATSYKTERPAFKYGGPFIRLVRWPVMRACRSVDTDRPRYSAASRSFTLLFTKNLPVCWRVAVVSQERVSGGRRTRRFLP